MRKLLCFILVIGLLILISGCYGKTKNIIKDKNFQKTFFNKEDKIAIMVSKDGYYESEIEIENNFSPDNIKTETKVVTCYNSGSKLSTKIEGIISLHYNIGNVKIIPLTDLEAAIGYSKEKSFDFLIKPKIIRWEERWTEWSGIADKLIVEFEYFDVKSNKLINKIKFHGECQFWNFDNEVDDLMDYKEFNQSIYNLVGIQ